MPARDYEEEEEPGSGTTRVVGDDVERAAEGVPIVGDVLGINDKMADYRRERAQSQALDYIRNPYLEDPKLEYMMGRSAAAQARPEESTLRSQRDALARLQERSRVAPGGAREAALSNQRRQAEAASATAQRQQSAARAQASGVQGLGVLTGQQAVDTQGVGRVGDLGEMDRATYARALEALQGAGELGSTTRRQFADEDLARRGAVDDRFQFDSDYVRDVQQRNADRRIRGTELEVGATTGIADQAAERNAAADAAEEEQKMALLGLLAF